jgi:hypothetical protein
MLTWALPRCLSVAFSAVILGHTLDDRDELDELGLQLVAEEVIDVERVIRVRGVDRAQNVDVHAMRVQAPPAAHHFVERPSPALVHAIGIVQILRAVHGETDEHLVLLEEGAPRVVQHRAVGLDGVSNLLPGLLVLFDERDRAFEEVDAHQRRLAALPPDDDLRAGLRFEQLADVGLERSSAIRKRLPGYSISFDRKKQYLQSRLQMAPVGLASR